MEAAATTNDENFISRIFERLVWKAGGFWFTKHSKHPAFIRESKNVGLI